MFLITSSSKIAVVVLMKSFELLGFIKAQYLARGKPMRI